MTQLEKFKAHAQNLKIEIYALYLAARDPRILLYAKNLVAGIVAYALSLIDLIPDFIPILGYLECRRGYNYYLAYFIYSLPYRVYEFIALNFHKMHYRDNSVLAVVINGLPDRLANIGNICRCKGRHEVLL